MTSLKWDKPVPDKDGMRRPQRRRAPNPGLHWVKMKTGIWEIVLVTRFDGYTKVWTYQSRPMPLKKFEALVDHWGERVEPPRS